MSNFSGGFSERALRAFGRGKYEPLRTELASLPAGSYDRVGVDLALALAIDFAACGPTHKYSVLEVGCGGGLISELLHACGYSVTGIDRDATPRSARGLRILKTGLADFLNDDLADFDITLLLSPIDRKLRGASLADTGEEVLRRTRSHVYIEEPGFDGGVWVATTIAADATTRRLYRIDVT